MNLIAVAINARSCLTVEADYLQFVLDLRKRVGRVADQIRPGLPVVDDTNATEFLTYIRRYALDIPTLESDWRSMTDEEREENVREFLPTVLVDFDKRRLHVSHAEAAYLNLAGCVPAGWTTGTQVAGEVPPACVYWRSWPGMPADLAAF